MNDGLGFFELIPGILSAAFGVGSGLVQASAAKDVAKRQAQVAAAQRKFEAQQTIQQAQMLAQQNQVNAEKTVRDQEVTALIAIGTVGTVVSLLFLYSALKKRK
jgi:uncharacterized membrane protein